MNIKKRILKFVNKHLNGRVSVIFKNSFLIKRKYWAFARQNKLYISRSLWQSKYSPYIQGCLLHEIGHFKTKGKPYCCSGNEYLAQRWAIKLAKRKQQKSILNCLNKMATYWFSYNDKYTKAAKRLQQNKWIKKEPLKYDCH